MADLAPNAELLRSLGRLVRGLSTLFWGLPIALIVCVETVKTDWLRHLNVVPPVLVTGWLFYGLWQLEHFQKQERIWRNALERAKLLALINLGLSPFLYWRHGIPGEPFFASMLLTMAGTSVLFLIALNRVLQRLTAMLPDETLRLETRQFTNLNCVLLLWTLALAIAYLVLSRRPELPPVLAGFVGLVERGNLVLIIFLVLLPLAMTMALLWKIKEVILESVFGTQS